MIKRFRLPVTQEQSLAVIYQRPDSYPKGPEKPRPKLMPKWRTTKEEMAAHAALPPVRKPLVVMMHGFPGGHMAGSDDLYGDLEFRLEKLGYPSVRFDFRGAGESDGSPGDFTLDSALEDLNAVLQWGQHDAGHRSFILMGESLGATVAVMGHQPKIVQALILLWPALILRETSFRSLFTRERLLEAQQKDAPFLDYEGTRLGIHFVNEIYQTDLRYPLEKITIPVLIQHGSRDEEVPLSQSYYARDHIKDMVDIGVFEGGGHGLRAANMRNVLYTNIEYFLGRVFKMLDSPA